MTPRRGDRTFGSLMIRYWLPVLAYLVVIVTLSSQPHLQPPFQFTMSDKVCHLLEYGGLGVLLARAWRASARSLRPIAIALIAISCGVAFGTFDEYYQSFVPGRDSSGLDLLADTAGVTLAQIVFLVLARR